MQLLLFKRSMKGNVKEFGSRSRKGIPVVIGCQASKVGDDGVGAEERMRWGGEERVLARVDVDRDRRTRRPPSASGPTADFPRGGHVSL